MENYIIDTNVLLHDPDSLLNFEENNVLIPKKRRALVAAAALIATAGTVLAASSASAVAQAGLPDSDFEIDLGVDVGRIERHVAKPGANRVDVDAGAEQMDGRGMSDHVWAHPLRAQRFDTPGHLKSVPAHHRVDSEARD